MGSSLPNPSLGHRNLTVYVAGVNTLHEGRFYMLWRDGAFLVIQAEPWQQNCRVQDSTSPHTRTQAKILEERRALWHLQEVIQTMLDTIVINGENNWAYLVQLKNGSYRLVYKRRRLVIDCPIWTKVVELGDIELTRFVCGLRWEGIYEGRNVDLLIGWQDTWGLYISAESQGLKLVQSRGIGHYFIDLKAHVSQNGMIVGLMMEPIIGRCVRLDDRSAVYEAIADIQRHGISFLFQICDIYITERGVRFASASSAKYFEDRDELAKVAESTWKELANFFDSTYREPLRGHLNGSRTATTLSFIIPRLPSPAPSISLTTEEAAFRWVWSIAAPDTFSRVDHRALIKPDALFSDCPVADRGKQTKVLLPPEDLSDDSEASVTRISPVDEQDRPLVVHRISAVRWRPYTFHKSKRLLLPRESDPAAPTSLDRVE